MVKGRNFNSPTISQNVRHLAGHLQSDPSFTSILYCKSKGNRNPTHSCLGCSVGNPSHSTTITQLLIKHPNDERHHDQEATKDCEEAEEVGHLSGGYKQVGELCCHCDQFRGKDSVDDLRFRECQVSISGPCRWFESTFTALHSCLEIL